MSVKSYESMFCDMLGVTGSVPELWKQHTEASGRDCFKGTTNASNYNVIPVGWGGGIFPVSCNLNFGARIQKVVKFEKIVCDMTK